MSQAFEVDAEQLAQAGLQLGEVVRTYEVWGAVYVRAGDRPWGREVYLRLDERPPAPGTLASPQVGEGGLPAAVDAATRERVCGGG